MVVVRGGGRLCSSSLPMSTETDQLELPLSLSANFNLICGL